MAVLANWICIAELCVLYAGAVVVFLKRGRELAYSCAAGALSVLILLSFAYQTLFLLRLSRLTWLIDTAVWCVSVPFLWRNSSYFAGALQRVSEFVRSTRIAWLLLALVAYLAVLGVMIPPSNYDSMFYNLSRVLIFQQEGTLFPKFFCSYHQIALPVGSDILAHLFLKTGRDYGLALFSLISFVGILSGVYYLGHRYSSHRSALLATLVVASYPELMLQASCTKNDIVMALVALLCVIEGYELTRKGGGKAAAPDAMLLTLGLAYGLSVKSNFFLFSAPFTAFLALWCWRRKVDVRSAFGAWRWGERIFVVTAILLFSQVWLYWHNWKTFGDWAYPNHDQFVQQDGLLGTFGNISRYTYDNLVSSAFYIPKISGMVERAAAAFYRQLIDPLFGRAGLASIPFNDAAIDHYTPWRFTLALSEDATWFGILSVVVTIPALIAAVVRFRKINLAVTAAVAASTGYALLLCHQLIWMPWNSRFFTTFFIVASCAIPCFLDAARPSRRAQRALICVATSLMLWVNAVNDRKPLVTWASLPKSLSDITTGSFAHRLAQDNIFLAARGGLDRLYFEHKAYQGGVVERVLELVPPPARIALVGDYWNYHYFFMAPGRFVAYPSPEEATQTPEEYLLCVGNERCSGSGDLIFVKELRMGREVALYRRAKSWQPGTAPVIGSSRRS